MLGKVHSSSLKDESLMPNATKNAKNHRFLSGGSTKDFERTGTMISDQVESQETEGYKELVIRLSLCISLGCLVGAVYTQTRVSEVLFWTTVVFITVLAILQVVPRIKGSKFTRKINPILIGFTQLISLVFALDISKQNCLVFMNYAMIATPVALSPMKYHLIVAKLILVVVYLVHLPSYQVTVLIAIVFGNFEIFLHIYVALSELFKMINNDKKDKEGSTQDVESGALPDLMTPKAPGIHSEFQPSAKEDHEEGELAPMKPPKSKNIKTKQIVQFRDDVADNEGLKRPLTSGNDADK